MKPATTGPWRRIGTFAGVLAINIGVVWYFHDRHWLAVDEGNYAHIAERVLNGEVLHRDVQDLHPGYINFVNAAAFAVFGVDLISLRYPLALIAIAQGLLVWGLFVRRDLLLGALASTAVTALGVIQFLNPTAHWYALFFAVCSICWLTWVPPAYAVRIAGAGALVGTVAMFRHLTGIWVAMAVLLLLMREQSAPARGRQALLARATILLMICSIAWYLRTAAAPDLGGMLLLAFWPLAVLVRALATVTPHNRSVITMGCQFTVGALAPVLPVAIYHLRHGSIDKWIEDVSVASLALTKLPFFEGAWFGILPVAALVQVGQSLDLVAMLNGLYWFALPLAAAVNGALLIRNWRTTSTSSLRLPVLATFYALVTLHLGGAIYLYYSVGLTVAAVLWWCAERTTRQRVIAALVTAGICAVAIVFHAGQSSHRAPADMLRGHRTLTRASPSCASIPRSTLTIELQDCAPYMSLVEAIQREAPAGTHILAVPSDAELYFLADRTNPFRFYNTALGILTQQDLDEVMEALRRNPPRVVSFRPLDKYNTAASRQIMDFVRARYERFNVVAGVELYRLRVASSVRVTRQDGL